MMFPVSMNRTVQRSAVESKARSTGLSRCVRLDAPLLLKHAALNPFLGTDAAFAATTPARASSLAV